MSSLFDETGFGGCSRTEPEEVRYDWIPIRIVRSWLHSHVLAPQRLPRVGPARRRCSSQVVIADCGELPLKDWPKARRETRGSLLPEEERMEDMTKEERAKQRGWRFG